MSGETARSESGWTVDTLKELLDERRRHEERFEEERDRRLTEVAVEREKALKIKETADETARILAREIQDYKDEKANQLREQIGSERGLYVTKTELKPIADYVTAQSGPRAITGSTIVAAVAVLGVLAALWFGARQETPAAPAPPVTVTVSSSP